MNAQPGARVAIVGGGMLGLGLALNLSDAGFRPTVYEAAPQLGGLAAPWEDGPISWDRFYHVILMSDLRTRALVERVGLSDKLVWKTTRTGFLTDGALHSMSDTVEFLRFKPLRLIDKLRLGATIALVARLPGGRHLERIPVGRFLRTLSGRRTFERIWRPLLKAKLGDASNRVSAAFIHATIQRMYAARRSGLKEEQFGYVEGGYRGIIEALTDTLRARGVEIHVNAPVEGIERGPIVRVGGEAHHFDAVALTPATPIAAKLLRPCAPPSVLDALKRVEYLGVICASVLIDRPLTDFYVTNVTDPAPFTGIIEMTALADPATFDGHGLLYLPRYVPLDHPWWQEDDATLADALIDGLCAVHPDMHHDRVRAVRIGRAKHVMAVPVADFTHTHRPTVYTGVPGVFLTTSAQIVNGTVNVDETLGLAEAEALRLIERLGGDL